jgi:hypothetical protein
MLTWTNMTRPGDPYRTGQQLYRRPSPQLAAFTVTTPTEPGSSMPVTYAVVYLPLHRTRAVTVTEETVAFGFWATSIEDGNEMHDLAAAADLDLMQARRHAAILAGHALLTEISALGTAGTAALRGLAAVGSAWADRAGSVRGMAVMIDIAEDLPGVRGLAGACEQARILSCTGGPCSCWQGEQAGLEPEAGPAVGRTLAIALVCARYLDRYDWDGTLDIRRIMAAHAWDCVPQPGPCALPDANPPNAAEPSVPVPASGQKPPAGRFS